MEALVKNPGFVKLNCPMALLYEMGETAERVPVVM